MRSAGFLAIVVNYSNAPNPATLPERPSKVCGRCKTEKEAEKECALFPDHAVQLAVVDLCPMCFFRLFLSVRESFL